MNRKVLFTTLKLAFLVLALWWLSRKVDLHGVLGILAKADSSVLIAALLLSACPIIIAGCRWFFLLNAIGIEISVGSLISVVYVGQFFTLFVPGLAGDDVTRGLYISRLAPKRIREALTTVVIDRGIGMSSLFLLAMVAIPSNWAVLSAESHIRWACSAFFGLGLVIFLGCLVFFGLPQRPLESLIDWVRTRVPQSRTIQDVCAVASALVLKRRAVLWCLLAAIFTQALICGMFWLSGRAVGVEMSLLAWMSFVPLILVSNLLPITFAGIGVRDYLLLLFIPATQFSPDRVLASSVLLLALGIINALCGGLIYVLYRPAAKADVVSAEVV